MRLGEKKNRNAKVNYRKTDIDPGIQNSNTCDDTDKHRE